MCGVPYHAAKGYIARLLKAGKRVASPNRRPKPRRKTRVAGNRTHPLARFHRRYLTTRRPASELPCSRLPSREIRRPRLVDTPPAISPSPNSPSRSARRRTRPHFSVRTPHPDHQTAEFGKLTELASFTKATPSSPRRHPAPQGPVQRPFTGRLRVRRPHAASGAAGGVLHYLIHQLRRPCGHLIRRCQRNADHVLIDAASQRNLDLVDSRSGKSPYSARRARPHRHADGRAPAPGLDPPPAARPHRARPRGRTIASFLAEPSALEMPRSPQRHPRHRAHHASSPKVGKCARPPIALHSLAQIPALKEDLSSLLDLNQQSPIINPAPASMSSRSHGNAHPGHRRRAAGALRTAACSATAISPGSTNCATPAREGKDWIAQLQQRESKRPASSRSRSSYNSVFGYFIEVTKSNLGAVPPTAPQADRGQRRALHHAGAQGGGRQNPRRRRAREGAGAGALRPAPRRR